MKHGISLFRQAGLLSLVITLIALPGSADAHRAWLLPSATVLSGDEAWITVDAAVSNDLFFFEHNPLKLDGLVVTGPDGKPITPQNTASGKYRSTFDVQLASEGTYRLAVVSDGLFARYKQNGEDKRWRGTADKLGEIPKDAQDLTVTHSQRRIEAYATLGSPGEEALKPVGAGLELKPITHPNDLVANSEGEFQILLDGKPAPDVKVSVIRGGIRYRDDLGEVALTTDADGKVKVTWPEPGMYWLEATVSDDKPSVKEAKERRATYMVTLEVLPE